MDFTKYDDLGAYHWKAYRKPSVYRQYVHVVRTWALGPHMLDIGCGDGLITHFLGAVGIDDNLQGVQLAHARQVRALVASAYALPFPDGAFETVFSGDTIEHLADPGGMLREAHRVLRRRGVLYLTTPPAQADGALQDPLHVREYTPRQLQRLVEAHGFRSVGRPFVQAQRILAKFQRR